MTRRQCHCLWRLSVIAIGVLFIASGVYLYLNWIEMFTKMRGKEMALSPTSPAFSGWKVSPLPLNFDVYLFNWTNPEDFYVGAPRKPHFEQLGPYRFREAPDKVDIEWHNDNSSISFRKKAFFYFDEENSKGRLTDRITSVNTVAHSVALRMKDVEGFSKSLVQSMFKLYSQTPSITKSAEEWMFKGFAHQFVTMGNFFSKFSSDIEVPYDRVGYLYTRNGSSTYDGHFNMFTGADDIRKMGQIHAWNGQTHNGVYEGTCGDVKGSMGEFFPPNLSTNDTVYIYLPNLCRAVPLDYTETVTVHGVTAFKFSGGERSVDNGTLYPEERCFCVGGKCKPSGVINIAPCKFNSSIYMSYPHFYKADPSYLEAVDGLQPDKDKHEFFMTLEPNAGVPMDVGGGFQANYLMEPVKGFGKFENIPRVFMPLMWAEERVRVTPEIAAEIALVPLIVLLGQTFIGILLAAGVILICWYPTKSVTQLCTTDDPKAKVTLFNPYTINLAGLTHQQQQQVLPRVNLAHWRKESSADVPLLEYRNGAFVPVINRSNPNAEQLTDSLLNDTLCVPTNVITR